MKIKDIMTTDVISVTAQDSIHTAITKMADYDIGFMVVMENNELQGVFTDRDVVIALSNDVTVEDSVSEIMEDDVITIKEDQDDGDASDTMGLHQIRRLVVLNDQDKVTGIVTLRDLVNFSFYESDVYEAMTEISSEFTDFDYPRHEEIGKKSNDNDDDIN